MQAERDSGFHRRRAGATIRRRWRQRKAKADDIEAKLHAGGDFAQLAKSFSDGTTASEGGDLGTYKHGELSQGV